MGANARSRATRSDRAAKPEGASGAVDSPTAGDADKPEPRELSIGPVLTRAEVSDWLDAILARLKPSSRR